MKVDTVSYVGSYADSRALPRKGWPEIAFVGRSNVGKSSLINTLLGRRGVARTSNTPGKTRTANLYLINDSVCFVDMPGHGYAQVSKEERSKWQRLISSYLAGRDELRGVVQLLDVRRTPVRADIDLLLSLVDAGRRCCLAFNKIDKLNRGSVRKTIHEHLRILEPDQGTAVVAFSSETGEGKQELWIWITESMGEV